MRHLPKGERNHHAIYHEVSHEKTDERAKGGWMVRSPERSIVEIIVKDKRAVCRICRSGVKGRDGIAGGIEMGRLTEQDEV